MQLRNALVIAALVSGAVVSSGAAGLRGPTVAATRTGMLGEIVVSGGRTLYRDAAEPRGAVRCTGVCAVRWPPLVVAPAAHPLAGPGVRASFLGTVRRPDGRIQVTYRGFPLYFFSGDRRPGEANGEGIGGLWHAVAPSGTVVRGPAAGSMGATTSTGGSGTDTTTGSTPPSSVNAGMWCAANPNSCVNGVPVTGGQSG